MRTNTRHSSSASSLTSLDVSLTYSDSSPVLKSRSTMCAIDQYPCPALWEWSISISVSLTEQPTVSLKYLECWRTWPRETAYFPIWLCVTINKYFAEYCLFELSSSLTSSSITHKMLLGMVTIGPLPWYRCVFSRLLAGKPHRLPLTFAKKKKFFSLSFLFYFSLDDVFLPREDIEVSPSRAFCFAEWWPLDRNMLLLFPSFVKAK